MVATPHKATVSTNILEQYTASSVLKLEDQGCNLDVQAPCRESGLPNLTGVGENT
jgi:hypothetical protein